jgi:hypothetical protein
VILEAKKMLTPAAYSYTATLFRLDPHKAKLQTQKYKKQTGFKPLRLKLFQI